MVFLSFVVDKEDDINIWYRFINGFSKSNSDNLRILKYTSKELLTNLENKSEYDQKQIIYEHVRQYYSDEILTTFITISKKKLEDNKEEIIKRLEQIHDKKIPVNKILVKYETFTCCPYIYRGKESSWFGLYFAKYVLDKEIELSVFAHEVMHLFFHYYFDDYCLEKGLSKEQTGDLKEAVTVILNHEMKDIIEKEDSGYPNHINLRKEIEEEWLKHKDFKKMLDVICEKI